MKPVINLFLMMPSCLPDEKMQTGMNNNFGFAVAVFVAFLVVAYIALLPAKRRKSKGRARRRYFK
jgi:hypothetical protein